MGFFVKKSVILCSILQILLLTNSSHADNHLPQVIREGDRKLLGRPNLPAVKDLPYSKPIKGLDDSMTHHPSEKTNDEPPANLNTYRGDEPSTNEQKPTDPTEPSVEKAPSNCEELKERTEKALKKMGEAMTRKLFGDNGKKGFRAGWNTGKIYLAVEEKCQDFNCASSCATNNCVLQVAEATGSISCSENCYEQPAQVPYCPIFDVAASAISNNQEP